MGGSGGLGPSALLSPVLALAAAVAPMLVGCTPVMGDCVERIPPFQIEGVLRGRDGVRASSSVGLLAHGQRGHCSADAADAAWISTDEQGRFQVRFPESRASYAIGGMIVLFVPFISQSPTREERKFRHVQIWTASDQNPVLVAIRGDGFVVKCPPDPDTSMQVLALERSEVLDRLEFELVVP